MFDDLDDDDGVAWRECVDAPSGATAQHSLEPQRARAGDYWRDPRTGGIKCFDGRSWLPTAGAAPATFTPAVPSGDEYMVSGSCVATEADIPNFQKLNMTSLNPGAIVLGRDGSVWEVIEYPVASGTKKWFAIGNILPSHRAVVVDARWPERVVQKPAGGQGAMGIYSSWDVLAQLTYDWVMAEPRSAARFEQQRDDFWARLDARYQQQGNEWSGAEVKITKHPTRRGPVAASGQVDPLTPWALRAGAARLLDDVTTGRPDDARTLKRVLDLRERAALLQKQLDDTRGLLESTEAVLLSGRVREVAR